MIEALIAAALVLVPLFLAIPIIAKYLDIKAYAVQSARYAAWERSVWFGGAAAAPMGIGSFNNKWDAIEKTDDEIRAEIGARLLGESNGASFKITDKSGGNFPAGPRGLWQDRRRGTLLKSYGDIATSYDNDTAPGLINDLLSPVMSFTSVFSNFTVDTNARYTAKIALGVQEVAFNTNAGIGGCAGCPVDFLATGRTLAFSEKNVLLANGWSANGPGSLAEYGSHPERITVYNQVRGMTPTSLLSPPPGTGFRDALDVLQSIALFFFPELSTLDLGRIEVDRVPGDRLK